MSFFKKGVSLSLADKPKKKAFAKSRDFSISGQSHGDTSTCGVKNSKAVGWTKEDYEASRLALPQEDGTCARLGCGKSVWCDVKTGVTSVYCGRECANSYEKMFKRGSDPREQNEAELEEAGNDLARLQLDERSKELVMTIRGNINTSADVQDLSEAHTELADAVADGTISSKHADVMRQVVAGLNLDFTHHQANLSTVKFTQLLACCCARSCVE
eukprot:m.130377 g.130377  ORF g.130377 m.130377 type:complete len:215 (-) comp29474_c5_seq1:614-1258(-)